MTDDLYWVPRTIHLELYCCKTLHEESIDNIIENTVILANLSERERHIYRFKPQGVSSASILSESHLTFHIAPEHSFVAAEISACGENAAPNNAVHYLLLEFEPDEAKVFYEYSGTIERFFPSTIEQFLISINIESMLKNYDVLEADSPHTNLRKEYGIHIKKKK